MCSLSMVGNPLGANSRQSDVCSIKLRRLSTSAVVTFHLRDMVAQCSIIRLYSGFGFLGKFERHQRSQRIGTGATPARYQSAVPLVISTSRLVRPYQRLMRQRCTTGLVAGRKEE